MIAKSISERSRLSAQAYNTKQDYKYLINKSIPKEAFYPSRVRVMIGVSEYRKLRACFDNYQDPKTLKCDRDIALIVKSLNTQKLSPSRQKGRD
jgi:hypothetical protein